MRVPAHPSRRSSREVSVSMSRSLVGSSSSNTFGSSMRRRVSCRRRRSPPERSPTRVCWRGPVNPSRCASWDAVSSLAPKRTTARTSSTASMTRRSDHFSSSRTSCESTARRTVTPTLRLPAASATSPAMARSKVDLPAPLTPTMPVRSPGARRQVTWSSSTRSPTLIRASMRSTTSLPRRVVANRMSSTPSRAGGSSAMRALAASIRNLGLLVRAGGPRRSQASSLRRRLSRRSAITPAIRSRSALAST